MKITALLAVLMAAVTHTAIAAESTAPLLEPLYPETYQEAETEEARAARLELDARLEITQTEEEYRITTYQEYDRADQLRGTIEAKYGDELRANAPLLEPLFPETYEEAETAEEARAARLELDARLEIEQTEEYRAYQDEPYVDEEARRAVEARVDGKSGENLFGVPLPP